MAIKHVKDYYNTMKKQYVAMEESLKIMQQNIDNNMTSPEQIEQTERLTALIKENFKRIAYIMYLFNMPNKPKKQGRYKSMNTKVLDFIGNNTKEDVVKENNEALNKLNYK